MKRLTWWNIAQWILLLSMFFWLINKLNNVPSMRNLFTAKQVIIDQTPILIKDIKSIAQLVTVAAYDEVVVDSAVYNRTAAIIDVLRKVSPLSVLPGAQKELVLIAKGRVLAGTNLQKLTKESIRINQDTIWLQLPKAEILEAIINPSGFETFEEKGQWTYNEVNAVKIKARQKMINRALERGILNKANNKAKLVISNFLQAANYKTVYVTINGF